LMRSTNSRTGSVSDAAVGSGMPGFSAQGE
jgi:hypothetical protein